MIKELRILTAQRAVTAAGTPEMIKEAPEFTQNKVISITIRALEANTGDTYIVYGDARATAATTGYILAPGEALTLDVSKFADAYLDLSKIWIDAATNANAICYVAFEVI